MLNNSTPTLFSMTVSSCAHSLFTSVPAPQACRRVSPRRGEPLWRKGLKLPGTRDKHPVDIPAHPCDSSATVQAGKSVVSGLHALSIVFFRFLALSECVPLRVCVLHTLLQPVVDAAHFLKCVFVCVSSCVPASMLVISLQVCVDRGHFLGCARLLSEECQAGSTPPGEDDVMANGFLFCEPVEWSSCG